MLKIIKYFTAIVVACSVSSCGIYTKFSAPEPSDTTLVGENITLREEPLESLPSWKEYFDDEVLVALIEEVLLNNVDLQVAELNISQAQRGLRTARLAYIPSFAFAGEGSVTRLGSYTTNSYTLPLTASWEVDLFGRLRNSKRQAAAVVEQTKLYKSSVQSQLIAAVATNYYALILADNQLKVAQNSLSVMQQSLETIKALKEIGAQNQAAVEQYEANLKSVEITMESLRQSVELTSNNLNLLLCRSPRSVERGVEIVTSELNLENSLSLSALSSRPDVKYAEAVLCQSFYGVNYARSSLYPSINITGIVGYSAGEMLLSALASVTQPLFMAGANRAALGNAKDQYEQDLLGFNMSLITAGKEVNDAMVNLNAAARKTSLSQGQTSHLEKAVEITAELMEAGQANYLEVLVAQNSYLAASLELETVKYNEAVAKITLYKALGGGVE
ncbi:MAG: efflux transporter outer membrane subunit [Rikenellaceae bacterium]